MIRRYLTRSEIASARMAYYLEGHHPRTKFSKFILDNYFLGGVNHELLALEDEEEVVSFLEKFTDSKKSLPLEF